MTFDTDWTPIERASGLAEMRALQRHLRHVRLVAYTALAIAGGLLAGAVLAIVLTIR